MLKMRHKNIKVWFARHRKAIRARVYFWSHSARRFVSIWHCLRALRARVRYYHKRPFAVVIHEHLIYPSVIFGPGWNACLMDADIIQSVRPEWNLPTPLESLRRPTCVLAACPRVVQKTALMPKFESHPPPGRFFTRRLSRSLIHTK